MKDIKTEDKIFRIPKKIMSLDDVNEFTTSAQHFNEFGMYCRYPAGSRSFMNFWKEEKRRCLDGYSIGRDYIPGYFYFYLNYSRIIKVTTKLDTKGSIIYGEDGKPLVERTGGFPDFWDGDYQYFHYLNYAELSNKHAVLLKTRGRGYSFKGGSMLNRNYFLIPKSKSFAIADNKAFLNEGDGILIKAWEIMSFIDENTAWSKKRHYADKSDHRRASYKFNRNGVEYERGYMSEIMGITLKNDPDRARGIRGKLCLFEESGKLPSLLKAWQIARSSFEQDGKTFGLMVSFGTGGTEGANFEGLRELFEHPKGYNILPVYNDWDDNISEDSTCGMFMPQYMNMHGCMDEAGNSLISKAREEIKQERKIILNNTKDRNAYKQFIAEKPEYPREAMMQIEGNIFPTADLLGILAKLEIEKNYEDTLSKGTMILDEQGRVQFKENKDLKMIYNVPIRKTDDADAPIVIFEPPVLDAWNKVPFGVYIASNDPYNHDISIGGSLGSTFILNKLTNRIVAEYTARPELAADYYEQLRRLLIYYNALLLYENEVRGLFDYFESKNSLHLLVEEPALIRDIVRSHKMGNSRKYGMPMTEPIKRWGEGLLKAWLLSPIENNEDDRFLCNMHKIRSIPLLKELVSYNPDGNYDRVMSFIIMMYHIQDSRRYIPEPDKLEEVPVHQSDFFNRPLFQQRNNVFGL